MNETPASGENIDAYVFRFDGPIASRIVGEKYDLTGWLLHSGGKPITGIRALAKRRFGRRKIFTARRKRSRPDVAEAFAHLPDAKKSGFLLELQLGLGRNHLTLQVREEDRSWRTFHTAVISAYPLSLLTRLGFRNLEEFLTSYLPRHYATKENLTAQTESTPAAPSLQVSSETTRISRVDLFATTKSNLFILEIGNLIAAGFRELGCESQLLLDQIPAKFPDSDTLQIIVTPHEYYNLFLRQEIPLKQARELTENVVLFCTEQPETGWFYNNLPWAARARAVADLSSLGVAAYRARGVESYHLRLGYHDLLAAPQHSAYSERMTDIVFLGAMTPRRDKFFAQHALFFSGHQCHIRFVPLGFAKTKLTRSYLNEERRNRLLSQSRLLLNVHYSEQTYFEWHRALLALANGCCFITETAEGYGDLVPGKHFVMADSEDLIACCDYYLARPKEAEAIAQAGSDFVRSQRRQAQMCGDFLLELESDRTRSSASSVSVSLDASPSPLPRELSQTIRRRHVQQLKYAITTDLKNFLRRRKPATANLLSPETEIATRPFIITKRQAYRERWLDQESRRAAGNRVWDLFDNPAYTQSAAPRLSIVVTLYNYAHHIQECLASIERAAEQLLAPAEVVIVNDASVDDSLALARSHQETSNLAIRIVSKHLNTGLADARNVGVTLARAPYVFMMDADNLIFGGCLRQLLDAIDGDNADAAYSLLCRFRETTSNRIGLLSYYDWDPQILVQRPYIDAMAMFRREALLQLGGYDNQLSQIGWFGWEDYDMWLRFAQNNCAVAFVPNILCLYRHHDRSMINLTNLFESELVEHLLDRYRQLVARYEPRETLFGIAREEISSVTGASAP